MARQKDTPSSDRTNASSMGARLRELREAKKIPLISVAEYLGYTKGYISAIETGNRVFPRDPHFIQRYAEALKLSSEERSTLTQDSNSVETRHSNISQLHNVFFIDREEEIHNIYENLTGSKNPPSICAITGISGSGKTTTAIEYALRYQREYQFALWIDANTPEALFDNFAKLATFLDLPEKNLQDLETIHSSVKQWLQVNSRCLLIFDGVDDPSIQEDFLSQLGRNHIILTTHTQLLGPLIQNVELKELNENNSILLLLRQSNLISPRLEVSKIPFTLKIDAQRIIAILGGLPFALCQAATYIQETKSGLAHYLKILQKEHSKLLEKESTLTTRDTIATWSRAFQEVSENSPEATELLYLCAFLSPHIIAKDLLLEGSAALTPQLAAITSDRELNQAVKHLLRYSLVQVDTRSGALSFHRLVQITLCDNLSREKQMQWAERAVKVVSLAFPSIDEDETLPVVWPKCQLYFEQASICADLIERWEFANNASRQLLHKLGKFLTQRTDFKAANHVYQLALELDRRAENAPDMIIEDLYAFAQSYQNRGNYHKNYEKAEGYYQQSLQLLDKMEEVIKEETINKYKNLFINYIKLLKSMHKKEEMEKIQKRAPQFIRENHETSHFRMVINDADDNIKWSGQWESATRLWDHYGNDAHITKTPHASFKYEFKGFGIEVIADPSSFDGEIDIFIDGSHAQTVNSAHFKGQIAQTIIFSDLKLGQGEHVIEGVLVEGQFALDALAKYAQHE